MENPTNKVDAIYELREAVEEKVNAEIIAEGLATPEARDHLLEAMLNVEEKTQIAIEVCHECGCAHATGEPHR